MIKEYDYCIKNYVSAYEHTIKVTSIPIIPTIYLLGGDNRGGISLVPYFKWIQQV